MGVADMAFTRQTRLTTTVLVGLAGLSLLTSATACSSDKKPKDPKIAEAAPRPVVPQESSPSPAPTPPPPPPISTKEGLKISQQYFIESKKAKTSHDVKALESVEDGSLLETSRARQERVTRYGGALYSSEEVADNDKITAAQPQPAPIGEDRWILTTGRQQLSGKFRSSIGFLKQEKGAGPWKMSFLTFSPMGKNLPEATEISTKDGSPDIRATNIDYGDEICVSFANLMNQEAQPESKWGAEAISVQTRTKRDLNDANRVTNGGDVSLKTSLSQNRIPSWKTKSGSRLVSCVTSLTLSLRAGSSGSIVITKNDSFENLNGKTTKWKNLDLIKTGMTVIEVPAAPDKPLEIVAQSYRALASNGTPA